MVCRGSRPSRFPFCGLTAAPRPPPTCRRLPPDLTSFPGGKPGAIHLTSVPYQNSLSRPASPIVLNPPTRWGDGFWDKALSHRRRERYRDHFALKRGANDGLHDRHGFSVKTVRLPLVSEKSPTLMRIF